MVTQMNTTWHYLGTRWTVFYTTWGNFKTTLKQLWDTKTPWGHLCKTLETILRPLWGQHWDNCGTTLTQLCYNFERNFGRPLWGQYWDNCGTTLTQLCYNFERNFGRREKTLGQLLDNIETISGHLRDNLGTTLGQLWKKKLWDSLRQPWDNVADNFGTTQWLLGDYWRSMPLPCGFGQPMAFYHQ